MNKTALAYVSQVDSKFLMRAYIFSVMLSFKYESNRFMAFIPEDSTLLRC